MFLIVFVTLVISIIGLYTQILGIQTTRLYHSQYGLMQTMLAWHNAAVNLAKSTPPATMPCQLTNPAVTTPAPVCIYNGANLFLSASSLPVGYQTNSYSFYSIVFQTGTPAITYVVTYVHDTDSANPANAPTGNLIIPDSATGKNVGYSLNSLMQQFGRAAPVDSAYGMVNSSGSLSVFNRMMSLAGAVTYTIPAGVPVNSFAIISTTI